MKKVGLLGGTFDPIHNAHLLMAEVTREEAQLDQIWFLPTRVPPHKQGKSVTADHHRLKMIEQSIKDIPYFQLCLKEFEREGPSYTYETIQALQREHASIHFVFIIGADMVEYLPKWHKIDDLTRQIEFVGVGRPGWSMHPDHSYTKAVREVDMPPMELSSTVIRERCKQEKSVRFMVPEVVFQYINHHALYVE